MTGDNKREAKVIVTETIESVVYTLSHELSEKEKITHAFFIAVKQNKPQTVIDLLHQAKYLGINLVESEALDGWTGLHYAATYGHDKIVEILLDHKAFVNAQTKDFKTPLTLAVRYGCSRGYPDNFKNIVKLLTHHGATPLVDSHGLQPQAYATTHIPEDYTVVHIVPYEDPTPMAAPPEPSIVDKVVRWIKTLA